MEISVIEEIPEKYFLKTILDELFPNKDKDQFDSSLMIILDYLFLTTDHIDLEIMVILRKYIPIDDLVAIIIPYLSQESVSSECINGGGHREILYFSNNLYCSNRLCNNDTMEKISKFIQLYLNVGYLKVRKVYHYNISDIYQKYVFYNWDDSLFTLCIEHAYNYNLDVPCFKYWIEEPLAGVEKIIITSFSVMYTKFGKINEYSTSLPLLRSHRDKHATPFSLIQSIVNKEGIREMKTYKYIGYIITNKNKFVTWGVYEYGGYCANPYANIMSVEYKNSTFLLHLIDGSCIIRGNLLIGDHIFEKKVIGFYPTSRAGLAHTEDGKIRPWGQFSIIRNFNKYNSIGVKNIYQTPNSLILWLKDNTVEYFREVIFVEEKKKIKDFLEKGNIVDLYIENQDPLFSITLIRYEEEVYTRSVFMWSEEY